MVNEFKSNWCGIIHQNFLGELAVDLNIDFLK